MILKGFSEFYEKGMLDANTIFVNDGSKDNTAALLEDICAELRRQKPGLSFEYLSYKNNRGKGWAIYQGILHCKTPWCLTMDADLSSGPDEVVNWLEQNLADINQNKVYIGSREQGIKKGLVKSPMIRRWIGLVFNFFVRKLSGLHLEDTQCGYKLYPTNIAKAAFENLLDYGFVHDVEVLMKVKKMGIEIVSLPLRWVAAKQSKVNIIRDSFKMFFSLVRIKLRHSSSPK